jgi:hypothetical protein
MNSFEEMVLEAKKIAAFADSRYSSDWELAVRSEQFKIKYGRKWSSVLELAK